jgi:hypothetical protein
MWFLERPDRSRQERLAIEKLVGESDWLSSSGWMMEAGCLCWDGELLVAGDRFPVRLRYPTHFPYAPPSLIPRGAVERWSSHQYGSTGELCLEFGPDNWEQNISGADMLQSGHRLLVGEVIEAIGGGTIASRDRPVLAATLKGKKFRFFMSIEAQRRMSLLSAPSSVCGNAYLLLHEEARVYVLKDFDTPDGGWEDLLPKSFSQTEIGQRVRILVREAGFRLPTDKEAFRHAVEQESGCLWAEIDCLVMVDGLNVTAYEIVGEKSRPLTVVLHKDEQSRLQETTRELASKRIAIIGCGSLGSKVATTLARTGVGSFILVDQDIFMPENLVRNELDWRDVGRHKVDALHDRLERVNPAVKTQRYHSELAGMTSSGAYSGILDVLSEADILIDASAESYVFNALSAVVARTPLPVVWGEVFAGGYGGMIARSRPGLDPPPQSVRTVVRNWCAENGLPVEQPTGKYEGGDDAPTIANDSEVSILAGHLSRFIIDVLTRPAHSQYEQSAYMIGFGAGWIFAGPFVTYPISIGSADLTSAESVDVADQTAELVTLGRLLKEYSDGTAHSGTNP